MDLQQAAHRTLGSVQPPGSAAAIRHIGLPDLVVVGCGESGEDRRPSITASALAQRDPAGNTRTTSCVLAREQERPCDFCDNEKEPPEWSAQSITCELGVVRDATERLVAALRD